MTYARERYEALKRQLRAMGYTATRWADPSDPPVVRLMRREMAHWEPIAKEKAPTWPSTSTDMTPRCGHKRAWLGAALSAAGNGR